MNIAAVNFNLPIENDLSSNSIYYLMNNQKVLKELIQEKEIHNSNDI